MISEATNTFNYRRHRPVIRGMSPKRFSVLARSDFRCEYCGLDLLCDFDSLFGASMDHVKPRTHGGLDDPDNLVASCRTCNQLKGDADCESIGQAREIIRKKRAEFMAGFVGRANDAGLEFPRQLDQLGPYAADLVAALGMCAVQAQHVTGRLRAILRNAEALEMLLKRYAEPAADIEGAR